MDQLNWAGNYRYRAARLHTPQTVEQIQELAARCHKLKVLGTRHSFNDIADTSEDLLSLAHFDQVVALDPSRPSVTVEAGIKYGRLCQYLDNHGYALPNMASLPHISVGGACATATHGSGDGNGNLATAVSALEMVTAEGEIVTFSRESDPELFPGVVVGLGGLGVVTRLTLDLVPAFAIRQVVYESLPLKQLEDHFDEILSSAYSVSLFTDWQGSAFNQIWLKHRDEGSTSPPEPRWFEATLAATSLHPIASISAESCTEQRGISGPWHERLPHFRMDFTPSNGEELQTEYFIPRERAMEALHTVSGLKAHLAPLLQISEIRTIAADDLWMSPCYRQACVAIHFTWVKDSEAVGQLLPVIEAQLAPSGARPHWGKLFTMHPEQLRSLYPKLPDFQQLLRTYDPQGKFRNAFLDRNLFGAR